MNITLALDWTPNSNHAGLYVAQERGWFEDAGLNVRFLSPDEAREGMTPLDALRSGAATLAICPPEALISAHASEPGPAPVAIAALLQGETSAIVTLKEGGITRPADLDGRTYASYGACFEDHIVKRMIQLDGGEGRVQIHRPPKLSIWDTVVAGKADATWVFLPWEGAAAERAHVHLNAFRLTDFGIPYGYSPLLCATPEGLEASGDALRAFLKAAARGYALAVSSPDEAAGLLMEGARHPSHCDWGFLVGSQRRLAGHVLDGAGAWGTMTFDRWRGFTAWLEGEGLLPDHGAGRGEDFTRALFSDAFLPRATTAPSQHTL